MDCGPIHDFFQEAEQYVDAKVIKKKHKVANAYWGKVVEDGEWPLHVGVRTKKTRLTAYGFGQHDVGWTPVTDGLCESDLCADPDSDRIQHGGFEEIYYGPERFRINTDWYCLESLLYREMPEEELKHMEDHLSKATRYFHEEFYRSRYIDNCENKIIALVPSSALDGDTYDYQANTVCAPEIRNNGFIFERRSTGVLDERYIRVNCRKADIGRISDFGLDLLDIAKVELSMEDDNMPFLDQGVELYDVVLADPRQNIRFAQTENYLMDRVHSYGGYEPQMLKRLMGTQKVWRDSYSVRYDNGSARFYPDVDFNATLTDIYDPEDPETWPRFKRVFQTIPVRVPTATGFGVKHVKNPDYIYAPFAINVIFSPKVITSLSLPTAKSVSKAKLGSHADRKSHDGMAKWMNPDWPCNPYGEKGFWTLGFGKAIRPEYTEYGYAYLCRMDHRVTLQGNACPIREASCVPRLTAYCYEGLSGGDADLNGTAGANRAVAIDNYGFAH